MSPAVIGRLVVCDASGSGNLAGGDIGAVFEQQRDHRIDDHGAAFV